MTSYARIVAVAAGLIALTVANCAPTSDEIAELRKRGEVAELLALAEQGHAVAQLNLGDMYAGVYDVDHVPMGQGVPQDNAEAVRWWRLAAEQGLAEAQFNVGLFYNAGIGVPQDYVEGVRWLRLAAEQGHARAQFNLGLSYRGGAGVPKDDAEASRWYRLAAEQGDVNAQVILGLMYDAGEGVPQDHVQAYMWLNLAASRLTDEPREEVVESRDRAAGEMNPTQIAEAQRLAREWDAAHPREP